MVLYLLLTCCRKLNFSKSGIMFLNFAKLSHDEFDFVQQKLKKRLRNEWVMNENGGVVAIYRKNRVLFLVFFAIFKAPNGQNGQIFKKKVRTLGPNGSCRADHSPPPEKASQRVEFQPGHVVLGTAHPPLPLPLSPTPAPSPPGSLPSQADRLAFSSLLPPPRRLLLPPHRPPALPRPALLFLSSSSPRPCALRLPPPSPPFFLCPCAPPPPFLCANHR